ncbi:MAG TPA: FliM/FliN family flagellar motor switch protein, partial [Anaeromyxobacter sp.]
MALPFDLPAVSRGFAALGPAAREQGGRALAAAAASLSALLGREVTLAARTCPCAPAPRATAARVGVDLCAVPAAGLLEVEPRLVVALVDALAGGPGDGAGATALTPVEASALELFALAALDGACSVPGLEDALAPRLARGAAEPGSALDIELELRAGPVQGRARLLVPASALRALGAAAPSPPALAVGIPASLRSGGAPLTAEELRALAPGDVVLLDEPGGRLDALVLPGGACVRGRIEGDALHVEEVTVLEPNALLPIRLEVELARVEVPLAELARLEPGSVLALHIDRRGLVVLRVGERAIGRGELVDVDGAIGVRVLSVEG